MEHLKYKKESEIVLFQGKEIMLENLSPIFVPEQMKRKHRELEQQLYGVFCKYISSGRQEAI